MGAREVRFDELSPEVVEKVIDVLGAAATNERVARFESALATRTRDVTLVLEDVGNAHNAAAIFRSAEAFGFFQVHVIEPEAGRFKVSRNIASGAHKWLDLKWHQYAETAVKRLKSQGYEIWVSDLHGDAIDVHDIDVTKKVAMVFGNERFGTSDVMRDAADGRFFIPMQGFVESFNVSVATALSCYDVFRRRQALGCPIGLEREDGRQVLAAWLGKSVRAAPSILEQAGLPLPIIGRPGLSIVESE